MKVQESSPKEELTEIEARNLSDIDLKVMIIMMLKSLKK